MMRLIRFAWIGLICASAVADDRALIGFWEAQPPTVAATTNYAAELRENGVMNVESLVRFLDRQEIQPQVLFSMSLLAQDSQPFSLVTLQKIIELTTNSVDFQVQRQALGLLMNYYPKEPEVANFINDPFIYYCGNTFGKKSSNAANLSSEFLFRLGEIANHETNKAKQELFVRKAQACLYPKFVAANGMRVMAVTPENTNSMRIFLSAMKWPLYEHPDLARMSAEIFIGFLNTQRLKKHIQRSDFEPIVHFLVYRSKATPAILSKGLSDLCASDAREASVLLWLLNEAKDSPVAQEALKTFSKGESQNVEILKAIQAGKLAKADAFEKPLELLY